MPPTPPSPPSRPPDMRGEVPPSTLKLLSASIAKKPHAIMHTHHGSTGASGSERRGQEVLFSSRVGVLSRGEVKPLLFPRDKTPMRFVTTTSSPLPSLLLCGGACRPHPPLAPLRPKQCAKSREVMPLLFRLLAQCLVRRESGRAARFAGAHAARTPLSPLPSPRLAGGSPAHHPK